ncbi:MAG: polynucleotide adenylyltransferase PcnB [Acidiferrobacterales bacterium]
MSSAVSIPCSAHPISRAQIHSGALKVLNTLKQAGFTSYLVGGCVRDLMLGREPKDFDVVTDARPEEIRRLFRNVRLIGRRFRLAHVRFGREIIEVATFRALPRTGDDDETAQQRTDKGRILRDNVFGTQEEDALRRDFTVNALYYDIQNYSVIDYVGGVDDLKRGLVRIIGDPETRYREDPVRLLRAVRFSVKLGFKIEPATLAPIRELGHLLLDVPPARMFEEVLKLFHGGYALESFELLRKYELSQYLFPMTEKALTSEHNGYARALVPLALASTDTRVQEGKPVTPAFLFAFLLWDPVRLEMEAHLEQGQTRHDALRLAAGMIVAEQSQHVAIPRRIAVPMREIWALQPRFQRRSGAQAFRFVQNERFRAAYDFLLLRAQAGETERELSDWWTRFQEADEPQRRAMVRQVSAARRTARKKRRRRKA